MHFQITPSGWGGLQLHICGHDHEGRDLRYTLRGARFSGQADSRGEQTVTQQDADQIRLFLDAVFPPAPASRTQHTDAETGDAS